MQGGGFLAAEGKARPQDEMRKYANIKIDLVVSRITNIQKPRECVNSNPTRFWRTK